MVMMDGTICRIGGKTLDQEGYDLLGLICGSEGLLGVITEVTVKILKNPQTVKAALIGFPTIENGGNCVTDIISNGICLLYTSPSPRDVEESRMPSSA